MSGSTPTVPAQEGARPEAGGPGAGAGAGALAFEAPRVKCEEFYYRRNINAPGRTQYIVIDTSNWEILEPTRRERSRSKAHGVDIYCLDEETWGRVIVVKLERSNSGKLRYNITTYSEKVIRYAVDLEIFLARSKDFEHMKEIVSKYVEIQRLLNVSG